MTTRARTFDYGGFTVIELVVIILVVALLSVFFAQRLGNVTAAKAGAFVNKLRADMRYAQNVAMTRSLRARVYFNGVGTAPAAGYAVVVDASAGADCSSFAAVPDPARSGDLSVTLAAGDYSGITVVPSTSCLEYDSLGQPHDCSANLAICSGTAAGMTVAVPAAPAAVGTVTVAAGTGAVN